MRLDCTRYYILKLCAHGLHPESKLFSHDTLTKGSNNNCFGEELNVVGLKGLALSKYKVGIVTCDKTAEEAIPG